MSKIIGGSGLAHMPNPSYKYITSTEEALRYLEVIEKYPLIEVDTETTGLDPFVNRIVLIQLGVAGKSFVFDVRDGNVDAKIFKDLLEGTNNLKLLQNAVFDYKMIKSNFGIELNRIYDTMLAEQLLYLGYRGIKLNLGHLVSKYLHLDMPKDIATSFSDYNQEYQEYQLRYAANDVVVLREIYNQQMLKLKQDGLMRAMKLEFEFIKPLVEMELNGMLLDLPEWYKILDSMTVERDKLHIQLSDMFNRTMDQETLFGVSLMNLDSPVQLVKSLNNMGIAVNSTDIKELNKYKNEPVVKLLLEYRKYEKFITTYGDKMIGRIHPNTGRLHTTFKQMVDTGRLSSANPNMQNIPHDQKYRSCFIAREGYKLITCDMSAAELRIIANLSKEPKWVNIFNSGKDLHTISASDVYGVSEEEVIMDKKLTDDNPRKRNYRSNSKAISFGLAYGLSEHGLALRLGISKQEAKKMINSYFKRYPKVHKFLEGSGRSAVLNRYSKTISGRRRYYTLPNPSDELFNIIRGSVERQGKNHPIQGCVVANTYIKGIGNIEDCVGKVLDIETGFGTNRATGVYSGKKKVYKLKFSNGVELGITPEHRIPVCTEFGIVDKQVDEIDFENDIFIIPLNTVDGNISNISGYKYRKGHWRETYTERSYPDIMDEKLAFVIGCLIGDGNYNTHNHVSFVCREEQLELLDKFNDYVKELFDYTPYLTYSQKTNSVLTNAQVNSVVIRGFLKYVGLEYVIHRDKSVPRLFFNEVLKVRAALLDGLFSTDGGVTDQSGPNYTTVSKQLAKDVQQLLFGIGINSNLKTYMNEYGYVYRIQIPKRFIGRFLEVVGSSVNEKKDKLVKEWSVFKGKDQSVVPNFIPKFIYKELHNSIKYKELSYNEKCHLRRFKLGSCSFSSWRKFYSYLEDGEVKKFLSQFLKYDFCKAVSLEKFGEHSTYDLVCEKDPRYFIANGLIVHNSNADTIKQAMVYVVNRIKPYDARLLLTVHDEVVVEVKEDQSKEVANIVSGCLVDGFGEFFDTVGMEAEALIGDCWLKG